MYVCQFPHRFVYANIHFMYVCVNVSKCLGVVLLLAVLFSACPEYVTIPQALFFSFTPIVVGRTPPGQYD